MTIVVIGVVVLGGCGSNSPPPVDDGSGNIVPQPTGIGGRTTVVAGEFVQYGLEGPAGTGGTWVLLDLGSPNLSSQPTGEERNVFVDGDRYVVSPDRELSPGNASIDQRGWFIAITAGVYVIGYKLSEPAGLLVLGVRVVTSTSSPVVMAELVDGEQPSYSSLVEIAITATSVSPIVSIELQVDDETTQVWEGLDTRTLDVVFPWDTTLSADGDHDLQAVVVNEAGLTGRSLILTLSVANGQSAGAGAGGMGVEIR